MNNRIPDSRTDQKKSTAPDSELVELIWRSGHVVMQSQSNWKPSSIVPESRHEPKFDSPLKYGCSVGSSSNLVQEDGPSPWLQSPLDGSLDREFFSGIPMEDTIRTNKPNKNVLAEGESYVRFGEGEETNAFIMPPPKFVSGFVSILNYSRPPTVDLRSASGVVGEFSSARMARSSTCRSNQADMGQLSNVATFVHGKRVEDVQTSPLRRAQTNAFDPTVTSSSGGSHCSFGKTVLQRSAINQNHKRKGRYAEDSECRNEEGDNELVEGNVSAQRSASTRKSRAAEVHNLSERRRRDRINEKMKALQELIPHCNKSDKASMLDEAIEYLKSLQLQLQMMWMGSGMAQMMVPSAQQVISRAGTAMGHASMPSIDNSIQLPRAPLVNHSMLSTASANQMLMCPSPVLMQNAHFPESYARCVGFPQLQSAANLYAYGTYMEQQNQMAAVAKSSKIENGWSG